jgi:hypothetical protein
MDWAADGDGVSRRDNSVPLTGAGLGNNVAP